MKSKEWIEKALTKPDAETNEAISKRARLAETLLTSKKERRA